MSDALSIIAVGACVGVSCALVGSFLVLRKLALIGDAISHAVLPGIALAFLLTGSRNPLPMVIGAGALGVITVSLVELAHRTRLLKQDASIGVVFPALFSIGVILISRYATRVDLDLDCVLHGEIAYTPLDTLTFGGANLGPRALWLNGAILLANVVLVALFYKELKVATFDAGLAATLGFSPLLLHYGLMTAVSVTVVGAFESVGAILVVAMLIVPPATAHLLTERLHTMLALACGLGVFSAVLGYLLARVLDTSIAGSMAAVSGLLFALALLLAPNHGVGARLLRTRRLRDRLCEQLLLLHLRRSGDGMPMDEVQRRFTWPATTLERVARRLQGRGLIERGNRGLRLTADGESALERAGQLPLRHA